MKDVEDALQQQLDKLTQEEALVAAVEGQTITCEIGDKAEDIDDKIDSSMKVSDTTLYCPGIFPHRFDRSSVKENQVVIRKVVNQVSELKRWHSFNLVTVNRESLTSLSGNELRKDLRKWIAPPQSICQFPLYIGCSSS
jgi:hypothetical protein